MFPPASPQDVTSRTLGKFTITRQWLMLCLPPQNDLKKVGQNGNLPTQGPSDSGTSWCLFPGNRERDRLPSVGMLKQGLKSPQYGRLRPSSGSEWIASLTPPHSPALALCSTHSSGGPLPVQAFELRGRPGACPKRAELSRPCLALALGSSQQEAFCSPGAHPSER